MLQADSLLPEPPGKPYFCTISNRIFFSIMHLLIAGNGKENDKAPVKEGKERVMLQMLKEMNSTVSGSLSGLQLP